MKKLQMLILGILLLGNLSIFAQSVQDDPPMAQRGNRIKELLKLTPDQEKKFDDMKYKHRQGAIDINSKIQKNRLEINKIIDDGKIEEDKILQLTEANSKLQGDLKYSATKHWLEVYKMLNEDQKAQFTKHLSRMLEPGMMKAKIKAGIKNRIQGRGMGRMQRPGMMDRREVR